MCISDPSYAPQERSRFRARPRTFDEIAPFLCPSSRPYVRKSDNIYYSLSKQYRQSLRSSKVRSTMMNWLSGARKLVAAAVAVGAAFGRVNSAHAQVAAESGSYATAWETPIYNDNGFFGPTVASMSSAYSTLYLDASLKTRAIPTDQWWTDLMFGFRGSGTWTQHAPWNTQLWSFPQLVEPTAQGMVIYFPNSWNPRSGAAEAFNFGTPVNISGTTNGHGFTANIAVVMS